jgi:raffinose/stachyose/melibiose transport system substrate-binding protein
MQKLKNRLKYAHVAACDHPIAAYFAKHWSSIVAHGTAWRITTLLVILALVLTACGISPPIVPLATTTPPPATPTTAFVPAWRGTITMYAQQYTPNRAGARFPLTAFRAVADEYERAHPGITIAFVDEDFPVWNDTVRDKAATGALYDVFWAQWSALNGPLPPGIAVDLAPYFDQPNPYAPDEARWRDIMNPLVIEQTTAPNGATYNINGDFVATAFFYNMSLFERANIAAPPRTWNDLLRVAEQLDAAGIQAATGVPYFPWWARHFLSDFYADDYALLAALDGQPGMSVLDEAIAINNGRLSTRDPRFLSWWPVFKQFTDYWQPRFVDQPPENADAALQAFLDGEAAMYYSGTFLVNTLREAEIDFEYGTFSFPIIGRSVTPYSTATNTANAVGGPNGAYQYAISTPRANRTMLEPGKFEAVLDWLRFIGTPEVMERVVNESGAFLPTWSGTEPRPALEALSIQADQELRAVMIGNASAGLEADLQRLFGEYLAGRRSLEEITPDVQAALDRAVAEYERVNQIELDQFR